MLGSLFQTVVAVAVWLVANVVYVDMKRKGAHGFTRLVAFWCGTPTTWITLFAVREVKQPTFEPLDDDDELLRAVRRDRMLRTGSREEETAP